MIAILGGLGAAFAWAVSTLCSSRSSRLMDPLVVVAWVMLVGMLIAGPLALSGGVPSGLDGEAAFWLFISGAGNVAGLGLAYRAMRVGQVALVAPLTSTEGAIAALIAILAGESTSAAVAIALLVVAVGISLASVPDRRRPTGGTSWREHHGEAVVLAMLAACTWGASLYATARAGATLPESWVVLSARAIGVCALALPLLIAGRLTLTRAAAPLVVTSGVCEVLGFYSYIAGARHGIAIAAVIASQFAALAAIGGYVLFRERLSRVQLLGVCVIIVGVAVISAVEA